MQGRDARPERGGRDRFDDEQSLQPRSIRPRHDDPEIPEDVQARQLDGQARAELKTLSKDNADWVARHLVMAATLIEEDPELAHRHALSAARRAGRIGVVRESLAITAYAVGDYALALRELRTYRRISGSNDQLPLMVDCERGLGRPDRALELGRSVPRSELPVPVQVQLAIAMSGARLDLGQPEVALGELEIPQLDPDVAYSWSADLFDAYATVLEELGREEEAAEWYRRAEIAAEAFGGGDDDTIEVVEEELEVPEGEAAHDADGFDDDADAFDDDAEGSDDDALDADGLLDVPEDAEDDDVLDADELLVVAEGDDEDADDLSYAVDAQPDVIPADQALTLTEGDADDASAAEHRDEDEAR
ncbi:tetratricopeptide repeat protein [Herbiconiux sp. SYSU D00978]|uniref:hypothetical protein n=1 Tax=Herbiconiux sp. SYSU D00978 TaxID=2812562 RepID=UPI0024184891|nr:hypothetical protein [Herbiconiux sp. SYSU D00978]